MMIIESCKDPSSQKLWNRNDPSDSNQIEFQNKTFFAGRYNQLYGAIMF